ncbi:porin [Pseudaminobacter soli (ex Li et al. 2025)]|uniref:Porin n=1 Tax=Pseudaminobacter soli (ex Li et al. 2025) TaxID=1295366 RepID=A0A2P7SJV9_9HYPH|nr:porin [Mesorhizobium soli]PSJ62779.1 porin [Mesorhizobium soli]
MNIKSLLLGSAAALAAVSGARAADAVVVAEPEPVEYVRICDVYGAGFYYIPGTETCLKVGGYIRYDLRTGKGGYGGLNNVTDKLDLVRANQELADARATWDAGLKDYQVANPGSTKDDYIAAGNPEPTRRAVKTNDTYFNRARAAMQLDARSETELGTLRGYMHINFDWNTVVGAGGLTDTASNMGINHAFLELGGFRIGKTDSLFASFTGYAGAVIEDDLIPYAAGKYDTQQIVYTYKSGNGFSAAVGLEAGSFANTIDSYVPHVVAGAAYTQAWGGISGVVGYDSNYEEWAGKVRLDVNASDTVSLWVMGGYGTDKNASRYFYKGWGGNWAVWGGGTVKFNKQTSFNAQVSYAENRDLAVVANIAYTIVPGFKITPEIAWTSYHTDDKVKISDGFGGMVRFQRSF